MKTEQLPAKIQIWKTIELGVDLGTPLLGKVTHQLLQSPAYKVATDPTKVDLVKISVKSCNFKSSAEHDRGAGKYKEICAHAVKLGLQLCPAEVGPQLRVQYSDQPKHEVILVGMEAIKDMGGSPGIFAVEHDYEGNQLLNIYTGHPDHVWHPDYVLVFVHPK